MALNDENVHVSRIAVYAVMLCVIIPKTAFSAVHQSVSGIFALYDAKIGVPSSVYTNPNVDGVSLRYFWSDIEAQPQLFSWSRIDADINTARRHGKKVSLSFVPGAHTPPWVYGAGAASISIIWNRPFGGFPECSQQRIPIPWDRTYLSQWTTFIQQLGKRYASDPEIVAVWLTGINTYSAESNLPHSSSMQKGQPVCPNTMNYESQWKATGYSPDKVLSAWMTIVDAFARSFPNQRLVSSITPGGFPVVSSSSSPENNSVHGGEMGGGGQATYGNGGNQGSLGGEEMDGGGYGGMGAGRPFGMGNPGRTFGMGRGRFSAMGRSGMKHEALSFTLEMNSAAVNRYGSRVVVMNDALSAVHAWQPKGDLTRASIAYQMLYRVSRDPKCMMNQFVAPCDPRTMLRAALNHGIDAGAMYIEVYAIDILNPDLQGTLADAHSRLTARAKR